MFYAILCPLRGPHVKTDKVVGTQRRHANCRDVFTPEPAAASMQPWESNALERTPFLDVLIACGATFLMLCGVVSCLLLAGCNKGASKSELNEQAIAETNANVKEKAESDQKRKLESLNNLKQIALAFHNYHDTYKTFPAAVQIGPKDVPHSWRITLLHFLGQSALYERYHLDEPWDSDHNKALLREMPAVLRAPDAPLDSSNTSYFGFKLVSPSDDSQSRPAVAVGGMRATRIRDIMDGTSNTILVVESRRDVPWTQPVDLPFDPNQPLPTIGGIHADGFCAALCDGSTTFIPDSYDRAMLLSLILCADGKPVELPGASP